MKRIKYVHLITVLAAILLIFELPGCEEAYVCSEIPGIFIFSKNTDSIFFGPLHADAIREREALIGKKQIADTTTYYINMGYKCDTMLNVPYMAMTYIVGKAAYNAHEADGAHCNIDR